MHSKRGTKAEGVSLWLPHTAASLLRPLRDLLVAASIGVLLIGLSRSTLYMSLLSKSGDTFTALTALKSNGSTNRDSVSGEQQSSSANMGGNETKMIDEEQFLPKNMKETDKIQCGANKCFVELQTNDKIGYLVTPSNRPYPSKQSKEAWFESLQAAWYLEKQLEEKYGILHFALEPPMKVLISKEFEWLNKKLWRDDMQEYARVLRKRDGKQFRLNLPINSTAYVQKIKKAPTEKLLIGCVKSKVKLFKNQVGDFLPLIGDKKSFARQFKLNLDKARKMLKEETCLIQDFQFFTDTRGQIYNFDFDNCFEPYDDSKASVRRDVSTKKQVACFAALDEIEALFLERLLEAASS